MCMYTKINPSRVTYCQLQHLVSHSDMTSGVPLCTLEIEEVLALLYSI